jgi:hypothetical protein
VWSVSVENTVEPLCMGTSITRAPRLYRHSVERPIDFGWKLASLTRASPTSDSGHCFLGPYCIIKPLIWADIMNILISTLFFFLSLLFVVLRIGEKSQSDVTKKITHLYISNCSVNNEKSINSRAI